MKDDMSKWTRKSQDLDSKQGLSVEYRFAYLGTQGNHGVWEKSMQKVNPCVVDVHMYVHYILVTYMNQQNK